MSHWESRHPLERGEGLRDRPDWVAAAWRDPRARVIGVDSGDRLTASVAGLEWLVAAEDFDPQRHFFVGLAGEVPVFVTRVEAGSSTLRAVMDALTEDELAIAFAASGLIGWHARAGFCSACGAETVAISGGGARRCSGCAREDYPRSDPAVIVAVVDDEDRLLLGRQPSWPPRRYSVLAGFAETGESLEQAVRREIGEEVGLELTEVAYLGSQPWPFPRSLMAAFRARALGTQLHPAASEIEDARWFSIAELRNAFDSGEVLPPTGVSIARRMIEAWLDGRLAHDQFR